MRYTFIADRLIPEKLLLQAVCRVLIWRNAMERVMLDKLSLVREYVSYNPSTGKLVWVKSPNPSAPVLSHAGYVGGDGYIRFKLKHFTMKGHIVAWALHYGVWPNHWIDHEDGNRSNNVISNLRPATRSQNLFNQKPRSCTGYKGVYLCNGKFRASIPINGKNKHLGYFDTAELGNAARIKAELDTGVFDFCESGRKRAV